MKKKLFVLSMDAMVHEDVAYLAQKPNFQKLLGKRAEVNGLISVYPGSTYPAHTTLMTGCNPGKHGVYSNFHLQTVSDQVPHWPLHCNNIFAEDLFAAAKRAGCTTAAVYWPITGRNHNIDHVINEYFFYYPGEADRVEEIFADQGADPVALEAVKENLALFPRAVRGQEPTQKLFDHFIMGCTCSLIRKAQPDVLLLHNCLLDSMRHKHGVFGDHIEKALDQMDLWLGQVMDAMVETGVYEATDFVILSDHGQMDVSKTINLNVLLAKEGFIELAPNGTIYNWQAYGQSNGVSTTVHLIDPTNRILHDRVHRFLQKLRESGKYGIEQVFTKDEVATLYGQGGPFSFMLEAEAGACFGGSLTGEAVTVDEKHHGTHGHRPEKGPKPVFLAHGPSFRDQALLETANLRDVAPTLAAVLGTSLPDADGRVLTELLK